MKGRNRIVSAIIVAAVMLLGAAAGVWWATSKVRVAQQAHCHKTLRSIGQAMLLYQNEHHCLPPSLVALSKDADIPASLFACPAVHARPSNSGNLTADSASDFAYTPPVGLLAASTQPFTFSPQVILAYERDPNHRLAASPAAHVLFADFSVELLPVAELQALVQRQVP
jgi:hypothetical protein